MRRSFLFGLIIIFTLVVKTFCLARETAPVEIVLFSVQDGLTDTRITALLQDSKGYLWIGTQNGLNRYDGYEFRQYLHRYGDTTSLAGDRVLDIKEDDRGNIWVVTDRGVSRMDAGGETFVTYNTIGGKTKTASPPILRIIAGKNGNIRGVDSTGILKFDAKNECFVRVNETPGDSHGEISVPENARFLYKGERLYILDSSAGKLVARYDIAGTWGIRFVVPAFDRGKLLIGGGQGLFLFDPVTGESEAIRVTGQESAGMTACYPGKERIWLAGGGDIYLWRQGAPAPDKIFSLQDSEYPEITALWRDRTGILWAGTPQGLVKIYKRQEPFSLWSVGAGGVKAGVSAVWVHNDRIWAGTVKQGIFLLDRATGRTLRHFFAGRDTSGKETPPQRVNCFFRDKRGLVWAGTDNGLEIFDKGRGRFVPAGDYLGISLPDTLPVFTLDTTFDGDLWMGSAGVVYRLAGNLDYLKKYVFPENTFRSGDLPEIYKIFQAPDMRIWVGGDCLLGRIEPAFGEIIVLKEFPGEEMKIYNIAGSSPDTLWAMTNEGPGLITVKPADFFIVGDNKTNASFSSGVMDRRGTLWMGSGNGLVRYNTPTGDFVAINTGRRDFTAGGLCLSSRGEVFLGGDGFVLGFHPDTLRKHALFPAVVLETVRYLSGKEWYTVKAPRDITIKSENLNLVELELKALDFREPEINRIMYRIDGDDGRWHIISGEKKVYLTDLKNRTYRIFVRSSGPGGEWSVPQLLLTLRTRNLFRFIYLIFLVIFLIILGLVFAYIDYRTRSLTETNKLLKEKERIAQKLQKQRDRLSFMHKNLTDSIRYAQKIQQALLPSEYYFHRLLPESFILFLPRDIVSGDFYWINEKDNKIFFAVADCTGHGVPGAFMSMIGFEILDKIINDQGIVHPDEILNILNYGIVNTFSRGEEDLLLKDGMDIGFCMLDRERMVLEYAGAFHTLYLIRGNSLKEYRGDRMSVGFGEMEEGEQFTRHEIRLEQGDRLYLFTDGYPDQFGGSAMKKFMYRRFRHLLLSIHQLPMWQQQYILHERFQDWKGDQFQVDDVLVIGIDPWGSKTSSEKKKKDDVPDKSKKR